MHRQSQHMLAGRFRDWHCSRRGAHTGPQSPVGGSEPGNIPCSGYRSRSGAPAGRPGFRVRSRIAPRRSARPRSHAARGGSGLRSPPCSSARSPKQTGFHSAAPSKPLGATLFCVLMNLTSLLWRMLGRAVGSNAAAAASIALQSASNCLQKRPGGSLSPTSTPSTQDITEPQIP